MSIINRIKPLIIQALRENYQQEFQEKDITLNQTKPEFEGDYTVVLFSFIKQLKKSPDALGNELGEWLIANHNDIFTKYNVIKGFLNLTIKDDYWIQLLENNFNKPGFGKKEPLGKKTMVEYSSPNTNKPLHLGHLRNNFLGWSNAEIFKASGYEVVKTCIVNDRGIHICKSMLAWQKYANGASPASTGIKGDHFVGEYYVKFENDLRAQSEPLIEKVMSGDLSEFSGDEFTRLQKTLNDLEQAKEKNDSEKIGKAKDDIKEIVRNHTPVMQEVKEMLRKWEAGDKEVVELWRMMNGWVYEGFDVTYKRIGTDFNKIYYESETYLLGKKYVDDGLEKGVFFRKPDGSVWIDLTSDGLDEKLVLRKDGTSVYITQDLGLAQQKFEDFRAEQSLYVIADEQNYHMKVLKLILQKLGKSYANGIEHMSYGMVDLPTGRMKSREGTVVDADDLVTEMVDISAKHTEELGKVKDFSKEELQELYDTIGLGALKFYLLRVDPKKRMIFNPEESIDFHGFTGPFVQYTHARIRSILRKEKATPAAPFSKELLPKEKELLVLLEQYPLMIEQAAQEHNPSVLAIYAFNLAKTFNTFYTEHSVMNAESEEKKQLRLRISEMTANVIASAMGLLGIKVPERM